MKDNHAFAEALVQGCEEVLEVMEASNISDELDDPMGGNHSVQKFPSQLFLDRVDRSGDIIELKGEMTAAGDYHYGPENWRKWVHLYDGGKNVSEIVDEVEASKTPVKNVLHATGRVKLDYLDGLWLEVYVLQLMYYSEPALKQGNFAYNGGLSLGALNTALTMPTRRYEAKKARIKVRTRLANKDPVTDDSVSGKADYSTTMNPEEIERV